MVHITKYGVFKNKYLGYYQKYCIMHLSCKLQHKQACQTILPSLHCEKATEFEKKSPPFFEKIVCKKDKHLASESNLCPQQLRGI